LDEFEFSSNYLPSLKKNIEEMKEIKYIIDDLLIQFNAMKGPVNRSMRDRFGN